ncbi:hypothetical protein PR202_ga09522 [Eleusine coracana subsp. coracana]|uniref:Aromatic-L-amino-acid decarboxylase n=1 Tax=Eleusine coracana subsp. coracana TaxID=191504 RepID=A0AAV5C4U2_ELECO|nr:hypothetical protein QOZ80_1AG0034750 [Eleusine coracana subsp. coracana]KAK3165564.1 hypothetical protein QOZ80_1AG0034770 [Eleusine coracana subsp. coracana]KAK3165566.1 hypothetical protein QOZ80_1AG0034790 [Eleusine coracana subsp. coracana]GJM93010.1 hypothetical protein PR202_ga09522 [Eleusine coracana subsp. coracana]
MAPRSHSRADTAAPKNSIFAVGSPPCVRRLLLDSDEFRRQGHQVNDFIAGYYARMPDYSVQPRVRPGFLRSQLPATAPSRPEPDAFAGALRDISELILPGLTHWQSPGHLAHFPASSSNIAALGEALAAGMNVAARVAGLRRDNIREVRDDAFALSPAALEAAMRADADAGLVPLFLCATVGTTQTTAVAPVRELCAVAAAHGAWVHVDAAYAGAAFICPEFRHLADGVEAVDSFSVNAHKWLLANNDCCALWVKRPSLLTAALGTDHDEYILRGGAAAEGHDVVDYKDWSVTLTCRFRALKLWLVLRCHAVEGLRDVVRAHIRMAAVFESMVKADPRFEVAVRAGLLPAPATARRSRRSSRGAG